ncbi:hypothetical protein NCC49_000330 [Naganishia albida]|nr:hypothetical protein NCC49_000330 [Naganishia albida]
MFKFDFGVDEEDQDGRVRVGEGPSDDVPAGETSVHAARYRTVDLDALIEKLPPMISFSEMELPFETTGCKLYRRDLYDARFQVIDELDDDEEEDGPVKPEPEQEDQEMSKYVDADTDLIPGTYEGGLKTWEGGMDLVEILEEQHHRIAGGLGAWVQGKRVLEVGCGTGLPSIYILHRLFELETPSETETEIHLQDYNLSVLQLVTLPNLILATMSDESLASLESNLELSDEIIQAFRDRLRRAKVKLSFSYGDWSGFAQTLQDASREDAYDLVMTAETIYRLDSVPSLIQVLKRAPRRAEREEAAVTLPRDVAAALDNLSLQKPWDSQEVVILVAAKILYFGVGGGMQDFIHSVERGHGSAENVKTWSTGVGRQVVRLHW